MVLKTTSLNLLNQATAVMEQGFETLPPFSANIDIDKIKDILTEVATRMQDNFPYQHPLYAGQMQKPPHTIARLAYALSLWINPNNHSLDGGRVSSIMEKEAVANIAKMFGFEDSLGHLCGGGTMANLEALWISSKLAPNKLIVASQQAHYTHTRLCDVLQIPFKSIPTDQFGRMSISHLEDVLKENNVGTVVVTLGTTAIGSIDPLANILKLQSKYKFRIHIDTAYGGYFKLAKNLDSNATEAFKLINQADSIVVDPHKHGLQPYGCGCVLFKDPSVGAFYKHDSPYTYFSSEELHLGEISLECSRSGSAAVALWATQKLLPLMPGGEFATDLEKSREAALQFHTKLSQDKRFICPFVPELDIIVYAVKGSTASESSKLAKAVFDAAAKKSLHLAVANLPKHFFESKWKDLKWDQDHISCLRSCLMKPEHLDWLEKIWQILDETTSVVLEQHKVAVKK